MLVVGKMIDTDDEKLMRWTVYTIKYLWYNKIIWWGVN
jgi:hypothetical protein